MVSRMERLVLGSDGARVLPRMERVTEHGVVGLRRFACCCRGRRRFVSELSCGVGWSVETGNDGVDSSLVAERVYYCLVEAVGCCWSGTVNNNITYNS